MKEFELYTHAHVMVAAVRVLEHQKQCPPTIDEVCEMVSFSLEHGHMLCRKLSDLGILRVVEGTYGLRLFIENHLKLEDLPRGTEGDKLSEAVRQFQNSRKDLTDRVASIRANQADKKKSLFAELEKKLKSELDKNNT